RQRSAAAHREAGQTRSTGGLILRQSLLPIAVAVALLSQVLMLSPAASPDGADQTPTPTEADTAATVRANTPPMVAESGLSWPLAAQITSLFGPGHPLGIDLGAPDGTPVHAAAYGTVREAGYAWNYGYYVLLDHADGYGTLYAHFEELPLVEVGDTVTWG